MIMALKNTEMQIINKNKKAHSVPPLSIFFYTSSRMNVYGKYSLQDAENKFPTLVS